MLNISKKAFKIIPYSFIRLRFKASKVSNVTVQATQFEYLMGLESRLSNSQD